MQWNYKWEWKSLWRVSASAQHMLQERPTDCQHCALKGRLRWAARVGKLSSAERQRVVQCAIDLRDSKKSTRLSIWPRCSASAAAAASSAGGCMPAAASAAPAASPTGAAAGVAAAAAAAAPTISLAAAPAPAGAAAGGGGGEMLAGQMAGAWPGDGATPAAATAAGSLPPPPPPPPSSRSGAPGRCSRRRAYSVPAVMMPATARPPSTVPSTTGTTLRLLVGLPSGSSP